MDKNISELITEFQHKVEEADQQLQKYEGGEIEFIVIQECIQTLNSLFGNIQALLGDSVRNFYAKARKSRQDKNIMELGFFVEHRK